MVTKERVDGWVEAYRVAWETRDPDAASALFATEATYRDLIFEEPHRGRHGVYDYWSGVTEGQSDVSVRMGDALVSGNTATVEFWTTMTSGGADVTLAGCLLLDFTDDGLCSALREYWNFAEGTHLPPAEWGG